MAQMDFSAINKGRIFASRYGDKSQSHEFGNCSELSLQINEDKKTLMDYTTGGGGLRNSLSRVNEITLTIGARDFIKENIALACNADVSSYVSATITDEVLADAHAGALLKTSKLVDMTQAYTLKSNDALTTYTEGVDFEMTNAGPVIIAGTTIPAGEDVKFSFKSLAASVIEALTHSPYDWTLTFTGINEAQQGKAVVLECFKVRFSPGSMAFIGDDFDTLTLTATLLSDSLRTGTGLSKFFAITQQP